MQHVEHLRSGVYNGTIADEIAGCNGQSTDRTSPRSIPERGRPIETGPVAMSRQGHRAAEMVLLRSVTPAVWPNALPGDNVASVSRLVLELARMFPKKCEPPLIVAAVPVVQKILQANEGGPPMTTAVALSMTVSAVAT